MLRPSSKDKLRGPRFWLPVFRTFTCATLCTRLKHRRPYLTASDILAFELAEPAPHVECRSRVPAVAYSNF